MYFRHIGYRQSATVSSCFGDETGSSLAYLNALTDPTLLEVGSIVERLSKPALSMNDSAEITQRIYGVAACDADIEGRLFKIGQFPGCPICSSTSMRSWAFTNPPKWAEINFLSARINIGIYSPMSRNLLAWN